ncbi:MAG: sigma 54-interacting transcriptional regulator [Acidobacteriota bacterium]|jgi:DNA-binding NtrC family response regulator
MNDTERSVLTSDAFRSVLDSLPEPALVLSPDFCILSANRAYRTAFGNGGRVVGRHCYEVLHDRRSPCFAADGGDPAADACPVRSAARSRQPVRALHVHHRSGGEEHQQVSVYPLGAPDRTPEGFLEILHRCEVTSPSPHPGCLSGRSPRFNRMLELIHRAAPTEIPVLVIGETGTGKGLVAETIHELSARRGGPFVPVSCSGCEEPLLESELFGHEPGTFAASDGSRPGLVEAARGGTLFLDEIGDLPALLQGKLLRLLETRTYRRIGGVDPLRADARILCATQYDLPRRTREGRFRPDLHNRISAFPITVPPLRSRPEDLPLLIDAQLREISGGRCVDVHPAALAILETYAFPGNVRELRHILERACLMAAGSTIRAEHLPESCRPQQPEPGAPAAGEVLSLAEMESRYIGWAARTFEGDNAELARRLGIAERTLYRKLQQLRAGGAMPSA